MHLTPDVDSVTALAAALGLDGREVVGTVVLAAGVTLVHARSGGDGVALRWAWLTGTPALGPRGERAELAVVLTAPVRDSGRVIRLAARLRACFLAEPQLLLRTRAATTREELVRALAPVEQVAGESPMAVSDLFALLGATEAGLSTEEAERRLRAAGENRLERVGRRSIVFRLLEQFASFFAVLLWVAGGFAFLAGMPELGWAVIVVIVVNGLFSFLQEYRAEHALEALEDLLPPQIAVRRDGQESHLATVRLVPGDVVRLEEGDQVPADGQVLSSDGLRIDQGPLTGESHPVFKLAAAGDERERVPFLERHEMLFAGTNVVSGQGTMVATATGMATEIGAIAGLTQAVAEEPSPLEREMVRVTRIVTVLATAFGLGFFLLGVATGSLSVAQGFLFALGVIVANVPEGLLPTLTLALAMGVLRMARQRSLVKRLSSVEALGATTVICTDKTGTLTENRMAARALWAGGQVLNAEGLDAAASAEVQELLEAAVLASQASAERGDPTEAALVRAAVAARVDPDKLRAAHPLLAPYPFDSFRKRMTLVRSAGRGAVAYVKGAPRETLSLCTKLRLRDGAQTLTAERLREVLVDHDRMAAQGLRILAVALRTLPGEMVRGPAGTVERDLTFLGLVALWDPPRAEVPEAVRVCRRAGIRVIMVTGDFGLTAQAIARRIGLEVEKVVTGEEVERLSPDALRELCGERRLLFARTSPAHKLAIVSALKARGEVVAVTGDGVNDAPALKAASIGVAMGIRGTEVAKEASDMVITDDNFASIVAGVREGRAIYANMGKFVTYIFASNVPELVPFLAFVLLGVPLPLTIMQILLVDLGTDLLPALALGTELPEAGLMDRPPRSREQRLLGGARLLHAYAFLGAIEAVLSLGAFFWTYWLAGWHPGMAMAGSGELYRRATTMTLAGIVATQVGNVFACRTDRASVFRVGIVSNRLVLVGIAAEVAIVTVLIAVPPLRDVFGLAVPRTGEWLVLLPFPFVILLLEEARKAMIRLSSARDRRPTSGDQTETVPCSSRT